MYRLVILYAPDTNELSGPLTALGQSFDHPDVEVGFKAAEQAHFPDVLAADMALFCSGVCNASSVHVDFAEMVRTFNGVNFAGKFAGLISFRGNESPRLFRHFLRDTGIEVHGEELDLEGERVERERLQGWADRFYQAFKERRHAAEI